MNTNTDFYLTLPSNACTKIFPSNTPVKYKIRLSSPIPLDGRWEVAVTDFHYPHNWSDPSPSSIYLYSNLTIYRDVGGQMVPLLGTIAVKSKANEREHFDPHQYRYIPVSASVIDEIEIQLHTDTGDPFPIKRYDDARVITELHFRLKQSSLLTTDAV